MSIFVINSVSVALPISYMGYGVREIILESTIEWVEESSEYCWWKDKCVMMLNSLEKYDDDVLVQFQELQYNISMMKVKGYKVVEVTDTNINFDVAELHTQFSHEVPFLIP